VVSSDGAELACPPDSLAETHSGGITEARPSAWFNWLKLSLTFAK
jgi:hypothetical protein